MIHFPNAKINIGLHITGKRADNYHDLQTLFYPVMWCDALEILPQNTEENTQKDIIFQQSGIEILGNPDENLCVKAFHLLKNDFPNKILPIVMQLHKNIPTGAGLGGGSADATAVLLMLNQIFSLDLNNEKLETKKLEEYASKLGSDCAFFVKNKPQIGEGRGEILEEYNAVDFLKEKFFVLVKPHIHISTKDAFAHIKPNNTRPHIKELLKEPFLNWKNVLENDFEKSLFPKFPVLEHTKNKLYELGASFANMSGSGATIFGIFDDLPNKILVKEIFSEKNYDIWFNF